MSFIDGPQEVARRPAGFERLRRRQATELVDLFSRKFSELTYQLIWESPLINAQAWRLGEVRNVYLYGGLVRHPTITRAGLALTLAHETGHHLGGYPRDPFMKWMTWQGQADYWAANTGMRMIFGERALALTLRGARQITELQRELSESFNHICDLSPEMRLAIFRAGAKGKDMPACAARELQQY